MRAIIVRTGALGDLIATLPVIHRIAEDFEVTVVTSRRYAAILGVRARIVDAESSEAMRIIAGTEDLDGVELGVAWTATAAEGLSACGVATVLGGTPRPPAGTPVHDHLWAPIVAWFGARDRDPRVVPEPAAVADIERRLAGTRPVVISPGSGGSSKRWPIERWRVVGDALDGALWIGGPIEAGEPGWGSPRWDDLDLAGLAALAARCTAWLCPDSGPGHLARAVGARTVHRQVQSQAKPGFRYFPYLNQLTYL